MADAADSSRTEAEGKVEESTKAASSSKGDTEPEVADRSQMASSTSDFGNPQKNGSSPILRPPKLTGSVVPGSTVFGGSGPGIPSGAVFVNPFMTRPQLKTDVVSMSASDTQGRSECIIAPSRLNPLPAKSSDSEYDSGDDKHHGPEAKKSILAPSRIGFLNKDASQAPKFQLRPSALKPAESTGAKGFSSILRPAKLPDPRKDKEPTKEATSAEPSKPTSSSPVPGESSEVSSTSESHKESDTAAAAGATGCGESEKFAAELSKNNQFKDSVTTSVISSSQPGFVFGENLSQRVTGVTEGAESQASTTEAASVSTSTAPSLIFGENLSSRVTLSNGTGGGHADSHDENGDNEAQAAGQPAARSGQTLEESAREYQAKHDNKVDLKEVQVITGEEDESNVLQANGKLFVFDCDTQTWVERGRGTVRLNDMSPRHPQNSHTFQSRLVMRTQGSLRVILNTKIWASMNVERASTKAIRITATDSDQTVRVFLIVTNPKDSENLLRAIDWRIQQLKIHDGHVKPAVSEPHGEKRKADTEESPMLYKQKRLEGTSGIMLRKEESDSSVQDPETEASCESQASSLTVRSESD